MFISVYACCLGVAVLVLFVCCCFVCGLLVGAGLVMFTVGSWFWVLLVWGGLVVCPFGVVRFGGFAGWLLRCWIVSDSAELSICLLVDRFGLVGLVVGLTWGAFGVAVLGCITLVFCCGRFCCVGCVLFGFGCLT